MFINNNQRKIARAVRLALVVGTLGGASVGSSLSAAETNADDEDSQKIVITGSRIKRDNLVSASPVTSVDAEALQVRGITRVEDLLNQLPQVYPGQVSGTANGAVGTATVDLRFLGPQRTLTLMNGRRLPVGSPSTGGEGADINQIPGALVERVDLLTGGASSTYGSDAIAGVVNFIMKDDFEGIEFDYQYSFYQHDNSNDEIQKVVKDKGFDVADGNSTDGDTHNLSIIWGANSADGKGNITAYVGIRDVEALLQSERDYSSCALDLDSNNNLVCAGSSTIPQGRITNFGGDPDNGVPGFDFQVDGTNFVPYDSLYNYGPLNHWQRPDKRRTAGFLGHYEATDEIEVYTEFSFMDDRTNAQIAPSGNFFETNTIPCNNAYLSAQQYQQLCGQFGLAPTAVQTAFIGRRNVEGGPRNDDLRHTSYRGVLGMKGDLNDNWSYDAFYNYATVMQSQVYNNDMSNSRIAKSLEAVTGTDGNITCQSAVDGHDPLCVPWNVFQSGGVTQDMIDYLTMPLYSQGETISRQFVAFASGDLTDAGVVLPSASNGASIVLGYEYRKDQLVFRPDQGFISGDGAGQGGATVGVDGALSVDEFFTEFSLPIVEDAEFAQNLSVDIGYRYSDYSSSVTTDTYKIAVDWTIIDALKIRSSFQSATRHANVRELFTPIRIGLFNANEDPCATNDKGETSFSEAECARLGVMPGRYGTIADSPAGQYNGQLGGNPDLKPEDSETISFGVVFSPIEEMDIAVDYFNITIENIIDVIPATTIYEQCGRNNVQKYCDMVNRSANQTLWVTPSYVEQTDLNLGSKEVEGIDFDASYNFEMGEVGSLNLNLMGTYLTTFENEPIKGLGINDCLGYWDRTTCLNPVPEWRWNLVGAWAMPWDVTLTGTIRYTGETKEFNNGPTDLDAAAYLDTSVSWDVMENATLRFGINNLLDKEPEIVPNAPSGEGNGNTFPGSYDSLGRYIFAGVTFRM